MTRHVVLIEDDTDLRESITLLLEANGFRVTALKSIITPEHLIGLKPDCFLLDEQLPYLSGHIICILLKSKPETKDIPVIMMSAHEEIENYASLGTAEAFISKPFDNIAQLTALIEKVLQEAA
ncbi:response regulator [Mucilaginibacter flavus]|uniref:response regulator n=1 Tax=Mucilaginibacter flavus TaxID=931504 RepID=UPI0025B52387|nr:response regulator [Mucilaginibacter flavus]MDN3584223.1 response regulator [Mucilaginibacter flavus]